MDKIYILALIPALLFFSCGGTPASRNHSHTEVDITPQIAEPYTIIDFKGKESDGQIPTWVNLYLDGGAKNIEILTPYHDRFVFVSRNAGANFNALMLWTEGFSPELDFPRMAAARVDARLTYTVPFPDAEYGAFYETLIRAASDAPWQGATKEDDFWILRRYSDSEAWEFMILVSIEKSVFTSQLNRIFDSVSPSPQPSRDQISAANRIKDRFFEGF